MNWNGPGSEKLLCVQLLILFLFAVPALAIEPLTDAEKSRLADVEALAKRTPAIREATALSMPLAGLTGSNARSSRQSVIRR